MIDTDSETTLSATITQESTIARRIVVAAILVLSVFLLGGVGYILISGVLVPSAPRTATERQLRSFEAAVEEAPTNEQAHADYARALIGSEQYATAARVIEYGIDAVGVTPALLVEQARLAYATDDDSALGILDQAYAALEQEREAVAAERAERGITGSFADASSATYIEAALLEAAIHVKAGNRQLAIDAYTKALDENDTMADVLVLRGESFVAIGVTENARADFERALEFAPDYEPAIEAFEALGASGQ